MNTTREFEKRIGIRTEWTALAVGLCLAMTPAAQSADEKLNADGDANKLPPSAQKLMDAYNAAVQRERAKLIAGLKPMKESELKKKNQAGADAIQIAIDDMEGMAAVLAAMGTDNSDAEKFKLLVVPAKAKERGVKVGDFKKGMKIKLQYVKGAWTSDKSRFAATNPDEKPGYGADLILTSVTEPKKPNTRLARLPVGTASTPFEFEFENDYKNVLLHIGAGGADAEGEVTYKVTIMK